MWQEDDAMQKFARDNNDDAIENGFDICYKSKESKEFEQDAQSEKLLASSQIIQS